jgi:hypothetical protein
MKLVKLINPVFYIIFFYKFIITFGTAWRLTCMSWDITLEKVNPDLLIDPIEKAIHLITFKGGKTSTTVLGKKYDIKNLNELKQLLKQLKIKAKNHHS